MQKQFVILGVALGVILNATPGWSRDEALRHLTPEEQERFLRLEKEMERDRQPHVPPTIGPRNRDGNRHEKESSKQQEREQSDKKEEKEESKERVRV